jgi:hypothetical protein
MFSTINFVCMPHKGWMKNDSSFTQKLDESVSLTLPLFPTTFGGFSSFSWWPVIFHFSSVTSLLRHHHLQHVCLLPTPLLHSTHFIQCYSLCDLHVAHAIFTQLFSFLFYFAIFLRDHYDVAFSIQLSYLIAPNSLSSCNEKQFGVLRQRVDLLARTKESGRRNSNNLHIEVMLQYYRKHLGHTKYKYDHTNSK